MRMLNGNILAKEIVQDSRTKSGVIIPTEKNYLELEVVETFDENIVKKGEIIYAVKHSAIDFEENKIVKIKDVILIL